MPDNPPPGKPLLLERAKRRGDFDNVIRRAQASHPSERAEHVGGHPAVARANLDDVAEPRGREPRRNRAGRRAVKRRPCGKIPAPSDFADSCGVVTEIRMVERVAHEPLERNAAPALLLNGKQARRKRSPGEGSGLRRKRSDEHQISPCRAARPVSVRFRASSTGRGRQK